MSFNCFICTEDCGTWIELPCGHEMCKECMLSIASTAIDLHSPRIAFGTIPTCPVCRAWFHFRPNGAQDGSWLLAYLVKSAGRKQLEVDRMDVDINYDLSATPGFRPRVECGCRGSCGRLGGIEKYPAVASHWSPHRGIMTRCGGVIAPAPSNEWSELRVPETVNGVSIFIRVLKESG
jgi:hypothetical protein